MHKTNYLRLAPGWTLLVGILPLLLLGCNRGPKYDKGTKLMMAASEANLAGNKELAIEKITEALEFRQDDFGTYFERAQLYAELGKDAEAKADLSKCKELEKDHPDIVYLEKELAKPVGSRFGQEPPSHGK